MKPLTRVAMVAGEASGDILGAGLVRVLQRRHPNCVFEGVGGAKMIAQGFRSHYPLDRLAVMGLVEPLKRLPELLSIRKSLRQRYLEHPPDLFIGIDSPDFNLALEAKLKLRGINTAHYVSPSVWAWRQGRIKKIARSVDLMLTLFPFEEAFYRRHNVDVRCVGHPLADQIALEDGKMAAREELGLDPQARYLALLPGSRKAEVEKLCDVFLQTATLCKKKYSDLKVLIPAANASRLAEIRRYLENFSQLDVRLFAGDSHRVMACSDLVLMASGTTTLEALLLKRPMVIAYRVANITYWILKRLVKSEYIGLPNLLAGKKLVPEFIQHDATAAKLSAALDQYLQSTSVIDALVQDYLAIHKSLRKNADEQAANALEALWNGDIK